MKNRHIHCYVTSYEVLGFHFEEQGQQPFHANCAKEETLKASGIKIRKRKCGGKKSQRRTIN